MKKRVYAAAQSISHWFRGIPKHAASLTHHIRTRPHWYGRVALLALAYTVVVVAFCAVLFVHFYPVGSFFDGALTPSTRIFDRNGVLLYESLNPDAGRTQIVPLADISKYLVNATITAEDDTFYTNNGVDILATVRALFSNAQSGKVVSGASTITQQLVRNVLGTERARSVSNKIKETLFALRITKEYSKERILELYLNKVYYGNVNYGVAAAAHSYFGKEPRDLDLAESAFLAGLPQSPNRFDPFKNRLAAIERKNSVLARMRRENVISEDEYTAARDENLVFEPKTTAIRAPHFVHMIIDELENRFGPDFAAQGLHVRTSIDVNLNDTITRIAQNQIALIADKNVSNAGVVVIDPKTGHILALVGSLDYFNDDIEGRVNMALASRQPGSAMKPITYAAAFEKGWFGGTEILDEPSRFFTADGQPYYPQNYDMEFHGKVSARESLANSYNIPAVKAIEFAGVQAVLDKAHDMGITTLNESPDYYGLALTLGDGEVRLLDLAQAYSVLATGGIKRAPLSILEIKNQAGQAVYASAPTAYSPGTRVLGDDVAFMLTDIMADPNERIAEFGLENVLTLEKVDGVARPAAVKTGTTRNFKDNWTLGFTPDFVVGVWVGNANDESMRNVSGIQGAGPIWHDVMTELNRTMPVHPFVPPASVEKQGSEWISRRINYAAAAATQANNDAFHIIKPFDQDVFQYQEGISNEVQQIRFSAGPLLSGEKSEWFVDDVKIGEGSSVFWPLVAGEHSVLAVKRGLDGMLNRSQITIRVESK